MKVSDFLVRLQILFLWDLPISHKFRNRNWWRACFHSILDIYHSFVVWEDFLSNSFTLLISSSRDSLILLIVVNVPDYWFVLLSVWFLMDVYWVTWEGAFSTLFVRIRHSFRHKEFYYHPSEFEDHPSNIWRPLLRALATYLAPPYEHPFPQWTWHVHCSTNWAIEDRILVLYFSANCPNSTAFFTVILCLASSPVGGNPTPSVVSHWVNVNGLKSSGCPIDLSLVSKPVEILHGSSSVFHISW